MADYWEDRITPEQHEKVSAAFKAFRNSSKNRSAQHDLYDMLTCNGCTSEEADEIVNMELENG